MTTIDLYTELLDAQNYEATTSAGGATARREQARVTMELQ